MLVDESWEDLLANLHRLTDAQQAPANTLIYWARRFRCPHTCDRFGHGNVDESEDDVLGQEVAPETGEADLDLALAMQLLTNDCGLDGF